MAGVKRLSLPAPAKINRFLHIIGRRSDGYHLLQTVFQFLEHGDTLHVELTDTPQITFDSSQMPNVPVESNLIYRAAVALQSLQTNKRGVKITIDKKLPMGAGLGGGSSNAATTLVALNWLWEMDLPLQTLMDIGLTLGADVPVFIYGHSAFGEGIGEILTPVTLNEGWAVVIIPPCHVETAKMYADPELTRHTQAIRIGPLAKAELENVLDKLENDFELVVRKKYPEVDSAMKWLSDFGTARLSGSGASVFTCVTTQEQAEAILTVLPQQFSGFVAKRTNISALYSAAEKSGYKCPDWGVAKR